MASAESLPHVVIVGAGFGGLAVAKGLRRARVRVTLIDRNNYFLFTPLLYQVATAGLSPANIAVPIRKVVRKDPHTEVRMTEVKRIDPAEKRIVTSQGTLDYDYLVLAAGSVTAFIGNDHWKGRTFEMKTLEQALAIRNHVLTCFETAESSDDPSRVPALMRIVIVGGGPTGVELAGAFAELSRSVLKSDFDRIDPSTAEVILIEAGSRVLSAFHPRLSEDAANSLRSLGVTLMLDRRVQEIGDGWVQTGDERIEAATVIWTAGVRAADVVSSLDAAKDRAHRIEVDAHFRVPEAANVFAIGDLALYRQEGEVLPGVAQSAIQAGEHVAKVIQSELSGGNTLPSFRYKDKGLMATIGRRHAVAQFGKRTFSGTIAWLLWLAVHVMVLVDFRNRLVVLIEWFWAYVRYSPGAQIIVRNAPDE